MWKCLGLDCGEHLGFDEVERKVVGLRKLTKASIRTALVYDGELSKSVPAEGYFDFIVPAASLFETPTTRL